MASAMKETSLDGLEFDGNTVLCRVCGDKASGFHYGVHACEGCKGFFRRSIQQKIQYRPCLKNQQCNIMRVNRNRCQYCRLKKCISVGMSRDAVRFGRVPKREKAKIMEQMQKVNAVSQINSLNSVIESETDFLQKVIDTHAKTCQFTRAKFTAFFEKAWQNPRFVNCPPHMACPLNPSPECSDGIQKWEEFSDCFTPAIRNVVNFAKCIPGFHVFSQEDQVTLLKAGTFEVLLVHLACLFDGKTNTMLFANGQLYKRVSMTVTNSAGFLLDSMFDYAERFNDLHLTDEETALFSALVVIASDRPGLRYVDQVERVQNIITQGLQRLMKLNHPDDSSAFAKLLMKIPDLRTLNTLHSEKLLGLTLPNGSDRGGLAEQGDANGVHTGLSQRFGSHFTSSYPPAKPEFAVPKSAPPQVKLEGSPIIPHHVKLSKAQEEIILQTPFGTFHRYPQPGQPGHPGRGKTQCPAGDDSGREPMHPPHAEGGSAKLDAAHGHEWCPGKAGSSSPDPLEMDMAPLGGHHAEAAMPKLSPAVSPQKEGAKKPVIAERPPPGMERLCPELYRRPDQIDFTEYKGPKMWDYDMRSTRSNSMSSNSSLESQDSAYRTISNPSTPRSGVYEARSPYSGGDTYSRHMAKENGAEAGLRGDHPKYLPAGFGPPPHPPKSMYLPPGMTGALVNPRLSLIPERPGSDDRSSKGSSRCSSPGEARAAQGEHHPAERRLAYLPRRDAGQPGHADTGDTISLSSSLPVENAKRSFPGGPNGHADGLPKCGPPEKRMKASSPCPYTRPGAPAYAGEPGYRKECPTRSAATSADGSAAMRHPELLSRLQSVPAAGPPPCLPQPSQRPSNSPAPSPIAQQRQQSPTQRPRTDCENHQTALSTLKDKILQRIDGQEEDGECGEDARRRRPNDAEWGVEDPKLRGDPGMEMMPVMENPLAPHPAYMPMPYPHTAMHPAIMYRYNQLAMQQFHALQQLHAHQTAQSQLHLAANGGLPPESGHRPSSAENAIRGESSARGLAMSPRKEPANQSPPSHVHIKCEPI